MRHPIVINKFRLGDRSERIAALADEWGCSVTVATARLIDAGLAAVDRDQRMTPDAIRAGFSELDKYSIDDWVAQKSTPAAVARMFLPEVSMEAIEAAVDLFPPAPQWPTLPDTPGKRMFDEAARRDQAEFRFQYLNEVGAPLIITDATRDAMSGKIAAEEAFIDAVVKQVEVSLIQGDLPGANDELCTDEACPGCGALPGDGRRCNHPDGCGYFNSEVGE